jgi:chromosome partitioning protein
MILGIMNQKGGVGRTTIAINLAACFSRAGARVLLVDADPQRSARSWAGARDDEPPPFDVKGMAEPTLHREMPSLRGNYDIVVIDGASRLDQLTRSLIMASDLVLVPVQPSPYDIWATANTVEMIRDGRHYNNKLRAAFVVNRRIANTVIGRDFVAALDAFPDMPALPTPLMQRVAYVETAAAGLTVIEGAPRSDASREIGQLAEQVILQTRELAA